MLKLDQKSLDLGEAAGESLDGFIESLQTVKKILNECLETKDFKKTIELTMNMFEMSVYDGTFHKGMKKFVESCAENCLGPRPTKDESIPKNITQQFDR